MTIDNLGKIDTHVNVFFCYIYDKFTHIFDPLTTKISTNNAEYNIINKLEVLGNEVGFSSSLRDALLQAKLRKSKFLVYASIGNILRWKGSLSSHIKNLILYHNDLKFAGHILELENNSFYIDPQFFLINVNWALDNNITSIEPENPNIEWEGFCIERSKDFFDNPNEPLWIKGTSKKKKFIGRGEGYNIINKLMETKAEVAVLSEEIRQKKFFLYPNKKEKIAFNRAKILKLINVNKVYITNTEQIEKKYFESYYKYNIQKLFVPASGIKMVLLSYYLNTKSTTIFDISNLALDFAEKIILKWDGTNFKDFINTKILNVDTFSRPTYYINEYELEKVNKMINLFGQDFIDWWENNRNQFNVTHINMLDPEHFDFFGNNIIGRVPTLVHMSNIWDYKHTASFISVEERLQLIKMFRDYWHDLVGEENFYVSGKNPLTGVNFKDKINDNDLIMRYKFPWN